MLFLVQERPCSKQWACSTPPTQVCPCTSDNLIRSESPKLLWLYHHSIVSLPAANHLLFLANALFSSPVPRCGKPASVQQVTAPVSGQGQAEIANQSCEGIQLWLQNWTGLWGDMMRLSVSAGWLLQELPRLKPQGGLLAWTRSPDLLGILLQLPAAVTRHPTMSHLSPPDLAAMM